MAGTCGSKSQGSAVSLAAPERPADREFADVNVEQVGRHHAALRVYPDELHVSPWPCKPYRLFDQYRFAHCFAYDVRPEAVGKIVYQSIEVARCRVDHHVGAQVGTQDFAGTLSAPT